MDIDSRCPACRASYDPEKIQFTPPDTLELV